MQNIDTGEIITADEMIKLCAVDNSLYERTFFPKTVRQESAEFHTEMDQLLDSNHRFMAMKCFRGSAKTSKVRMRTSKRVAYAISHTIMIVSSSQNHAVKSLSWIKKNVEFNRRWANTFQLRKGGKWSNEEVEIIHGVDQRPITIVALGITGQIRGLNIDDYRPDFIIVDDPDDEETTGTPEQIKKTASFFFGGLEKSLAPASEATSAQMLLLQTPLVNGDLIDVCSNDPQWHCVTFSCFDINGNSTWPARWSTEELQANKEAHIKRNQLALWMREMECQVVPEGGSSFNPDNLLYYDELPDGMVYVIAIDPASSESKTADDQVIMVLGFYRSDVYIIEYSACKGEMPEEAGVKVIEFAKRYRPIGITVESISYQRVLAHFLENKMRESRTFVPVHRRQDKRKKSDRIIQAIGSTAGYSRLKIKTTMSKFIEQYLMYSPTSKMHDDVLDAAAMGIDYGAELAIPEWDQWNTIEGDYTVVQDSNRRELEFRACP